MFAFLAASAEIGKHFQISRMGYEEVWAMRDVATAAENLLPAEVQEEMALKFDKTWNMTKQVLLDMKEDVKSVVERMTMALVPGYSEEEDEKVPKKDKVYEKTETKLETEKAEKTEKTEKLDPERIVPAGKT